MLIAKLSFLSAAALLPLSAKGQIRGDHAYEPRLPPLLPVEHLGPCNTGPKLVVASPRPDAPLAPLHLALPIGSYNKAIGSANKAELAVPIEAAISIYLSEIEEYVGDAIFEVAWLTRNYALFRNDRPELALPKVTSAHMSRCLRALGHERLRRDGRHRGGDGRRAVVFYIKSRPTTRRAA